MQRLADTLLYNPFVHAGHILEQFREYRTFVVSDYDKTQTTKDAVPGVRELHDRAAFMQLVGELQAVLACITARTPALAMSRASYQASVENGYREPPPRWHKVDGKYVEVDPAEEPFFMHNHDWPVIGSFGRGILVKNGKGYWVDKGYEQLLGSQILNPDGTARLATHAWAENEEMPIEESPWRVAAMAFVSTSLAFARECLAPIEFTTNYLRGETNVAPLPYRVQFNFAGPEGFRIMLKVKQKITEEKHNNNPFALRVFTVDESRINQHDPDSSHYVLYLVPWHGRKENMFNRMLSQLIEASRLLPQGEHPGEELVREVYKSIKLYYAGDSPTDLKIGLIGGGQVKTHFVLPTGSDLAESLMERRTRYGVVNLSFLWDDPARKRQNPRLVSTGRAGEYYFVHKIQKMLGHAPNLVVIGNERYPQMTPPGSVALFLDEYR